jgi:DNA-binding response OmpR family regulator
MKEPEILWVDDEIDLLQIHILFLTEKGNTVKTANNADKALEMIRERAFDIVFLDENMPGKSGLQILSEIKTIRPAMPVVMVTKSEEEDIMEDAIGAHIDDYLIKPVNPKQLLLAIKKHVDSNRIIDEKTTSSYQAEFRELSNRISATKTHNDWIEVYKKLTFRELELDKSTDNSMNEVLKLQKTEANSLFGKFIKTEYTKWFENGRTDRPNMPFDFFRQKVFPLTDKGEQVFVLVIDNLRFDQWRIIQPLINRYMNTESEEIWFSLLPTSTQYARNALFAGLTPAEVAKRYPDKWLDDEDEGGKNLEEETLLNQLFERYRRKVKIGYEKIMNNKAGSKIIENFANYAENQLMVVVYNFVDIISHARTDLNMIRELTDDEAAYRSLTLTWFEHSALPDLIKILAEKKIKTIITTDHGSIKVYNPIKVIGDRNTTTNLRYKQGKSLNYNKKEVFEILHPEKAGLPSTNLSSTYIFALNNDFFAYPNNYNHYVKYYKDTFQHGGISLEEMLIPMITLVPK